MANPKTLGQQIGSRTDPADRGTKTDWDGGGGGTGAYSAL